VHLPPAFLQQLEAGEAHDTTLTLGSHEDFSYRERTVGPRVTVWSARGIEIVTRSSLPTTRVV
jgi:hypothetical protein